MKIAIDGPSGAGKSTIAKLLSKRTGMLYLDTGAMYRALALKTYLTNTDINDLSAIKSILDTTDISIDNSVVPMKIYLDGQDVSERIREHHISALASSVSALQPVREKLVNLQRKISQKSDCILDGRDIGTHVLPDAEIKIFLVADVAERAKRRYNELIQKGADCDFEQIKRDIEQRDYNDSHRKISPLKKAEDAIEIDSTNMTIEQVVDTIISLIKKEQKWKNLA